MRAVTLRHDYLDTELTLPATLVEKCIEVLGDRLDATLVSEAFTALYFDPQADIDGYEVFLDTDIPATSRILSELAVIVYKEEGEHLFILSTSLYGTAINIADHQVSIAYSSDIQDTIDFLKSVGREDYFLMSYGFELGTVGDYDPLIVDTVHQATKGHAGARTPVANAEYVEWINQFNELTCSKYGNGSAAIIMYGDRWDLAQVAYAFYLEGFDAKSSSYILERLIDETHYEKSGRYNLAIEDSELTHALAEEYVPALSLGWDWVETEEQFKLLTKGFTRKAKMLSKDHRLILQAKGRKSFWYEQKVSVRLCHAELGAIRMLKNPSIMEDSSLLNNARGVWMLEQILGKAVTECSKYTIQHAEFDFQDYPANKPVPTKFAVGVARSQEALAWLSQLKGEIDWSKGNTYKKAIMASIERVLGLKDTNGTLWGCPSALKVPAFFESINHKEATPYAYETHTVENAQGWTIKPVDKGSIDNLIIGDLTGCCQKLGGWGEHVCIDGWDDEHNINYGIYSPNGNLRAHFWTYMDKSGRLVVDSIEGAVLLEDDTKFIGFELISRWIGSSKYPVLVSETCYGITDAFCDWMVNFTGTMTSVKNHEPKGFYRYLDNKHEKAFFFPSYFCQTVPVAHDEKWCYDHDEYLKKAHAVRGPVDEPCDPYEWDDEYDEDIDF